MFGGGGIGNDKGKATRDPNWSPRSSSTCISSSAAQSYIENTRPVESRSNSLTSCARTGCTAPAFVEYSARDDGW
jgi:hypothetical protein